VDPVAECIAANEHFLELRKQGKLIDARSQLALCAASTCPDAIQQACRARIADLNGSIPSVVFEVKDQAGRDRMDVSLSIDGQAAGIAGVTALPVDPGQHTFRFEAKGQAPVERVLVLRQGEREKREAIVLGPAVAASTKDDSTTAAAGAPASQSMPSSSGEDHTTGPNTGSTQRLVGWIVGGGGVVALGVGGVIALVAKSSYDAASGCAARTCSTPAGVATTNSARSLGDAATVLLIAGGAVAAGGAVLWLTAPRGKATPIQASSWSVGLTVGGALMQARF
jgi:hypothetical protein